MDKDSVERLLIKSCAIAITTILCVYYITDTIDHYSTQKHIPTNGKLEQCPIIDKMGVDEVIWVRDCKKLIDKLEKYDLLGK